MGRLLLEVSGHPSPVDEPCTGPGAPCKWCERPIPEVSEAGRRVRRDAETCSKACRQSHWRFARHRPRGATPRAVARARIGYADPPYPRKAYLYKGHPDYAGEVDHVALVEQLEADYDAWVLHTNSPGLAVVVPALVERGSTGWRVGAWVRGPRKVKSNTPWQAWEPVVYRPARPVHGVSDVLECGVTPRLTDPKRVIGAKPARVVFWAFQLGAAAGDELVDMFPGSGGVARAWDLFCQGAA